MPISIFDQTTGLKITLVDSERPSALKVFEIAESGGICMTVRSKVRCESIDAGRVLFQCVYEPDAAKDTENARFTKATPWGQIHLAIDNPTALEQFKVGESYYVDFSPAPQ